MTQRQPRIRLGLRANLAQFTLLVVVNALVGGMLGQERMGRSPAGQGSLRNHRNRGRVDLHRRVRIGEGGNQLRGGDFIGSLRTQAAARRRMGDRTPGSVAADLGPKLGLGGVCQRVARRQSRPHMVNDRDHEDRPRRAETARAGHGFERSRRVFGGVRNGIAHGIHRRPGAITARALLPGHCLRGAGSRIVDHRGARNS